MQGKSYTKKDTLLLIADCGVDTGFAQVSHNLIEYLSVHYDIHVLAINYYGDPHPIQSKAALYNPAATVHGDYYGINRVKPLMRKLKPSAVLVINDPWVAANYAELLEEFKDVVKILYTPVDAPHLKEEYVTELWRFDHVVGYTDFAVQELNVAGLTVATSNIPHGINTKLYKPINRKEARERNGFKDDWFIVNVTDRNAPRKRIDLALYAFSQWVKQTGKDVNVKIHYHGAIHDKGWDIMDLAKYLGISYPKNPDKSRFIITAPNITAAEGLPLELMPYVYAPADVGLSLGHEGWGLTTMERMAMRIPMIVSRYSALAEWAKGGVHYMDVSTTPSFTTDGLNTMSAYPTVETIIDALEYMYQHPEYRNKIAQAGYELVTQKRFQWKVIAEQFNTLIKDTRLKMKETNDNGHITKTNKESKRQAHQTNPTAVGIE